MARGSALSISHAWNSVALEERLELVSKCQADGIIASLVFAFMMGAVAYGFDKFFLLTVAIAGAILIMPMFSSYSWRKGKPALILQYLAARSIARRYAYGFNVSDLDIVLIFRGEMLEQFVSDEEEFAYRSTQEVDLEHSSARNIPVWVCLMRGGLVLMSEKAGGAKLEFVTSIVREMSCEPTVTEEGVPTGAISVSGTGPSKGRRVSVSSRYPGAMYVFEKHLRRLIEEAPDQKVY